MLYAAGQINCTNNIKTNIDNIKKLIDYGSAVGADWCITPEYALTGHVDNMDDWVDPKPSIEEIVAYAKDKNVGLFLGTLYESEEPDKVYNQIRVYDKDGSFIKAANKIRCWGSIEKFEYSSEAIENNVIKLPNGEKVGILVCNDLWGNGWDEGPNIPRTMVGYYGAGFFIHCTNATRDTPSVRDSCLREYHSAWIRATGLDEHIISVDNACNMNGTPYTGPTSSQSGAVFKGEWVRKASERGVDYFHVRLGGPYKKE